MHPLPVPAELPPAFLEHFLNRQQREILLAVAAIAGLLALIAGGVWLIVRSQRRLQRMADERTRDIQAALGPTFTATDTAPSLFLELLRRTSPTLRRQDIRHVTNRFEEAAADGRRVQLLDAGYDVSTGKGGRFTVWQTVAHLAARDWHFPPFSVKPRGFWSRLGLGRRGVRFALHPKFTALYRVQCGDESAARAFLTDTLLEALKRTPGLTIEGRGSNLLILRRKKILPAAQFPHFLAEARQIGALLPPAFGEPTPPPRH